MTGIIHSKEAQPTILLVAVSGLAAGYRVEPAASMSKKNEGLPLASSDKGAVALYLKNSSSDTDARVANKLLIITKQTGKIRKKHMPRGPTAHGPMAAVASVSPRDALGKWRISHSRTQSPNLKREASNKQQEAQQTDYKSEKPNLLAEKKHQTSDRCQKGLVDDASFKCKAVCGPRDRLLLAG